MRSVNKRDPCRFTARFKAVIATHLQVGCLGLEQGRSL